MIESTATGCYILIPTDFPVVQGEPTGPAPLIGAPAEDETLAGGITANITGAGGDGGNVNP